MGTCTQKTQAHLHVVGMNNVNTQEKSVLQDNAIKVYQGLLPRSEQHFSYVYHSHINVIRIFQRIPAWYPRRNVPIP